ncbi:MAG TPA: choice-of-anchor D domain-containing protein, partial [Desulfuromonadales bacterium]|nr:choice-of-anchor D domain-containing protein [Desulfuromonadales bacterium]
TAIAVGVQMITVTDSVPPATDGFLDFGQVPPGESAATSIRVLNTGSLAVSLGEVVANFAGGPFALDSDDCSRQTLTVGQACTLVVRFAPFEAGNFAAGLEIATDIPDQPVAAIDLRGVGNTPPVAPEPLLPADGAKVGTAVTFSWLPASDADGDALSQELVYATDAEFTAPDTLPLPPAAALLGAGGLLLAGLGIGLSRRRHRLAGYCLLAGLLLTMVACGGGGDDDSDDGPDLPADAQSSIVEGLVPGTTYYWKLVVRDAWGAKTESAVRSFRVE